MALLIEKKLNILGDISINQIYVRVKYTVFTNGYGVSIIPSCYISKDSYKKDENNTIKIEGIPDQLYYPYNRDNDGLDVLYVCNQALKTNLSTDKIGRREIGVDPSTGEPIWENYIIEEKFAQDSSINIVDII